MQISLPIMLVAFVCELVDSSLGMGYGTTLTPLLLLMGFSPLEVVPCVLISELLTGLSAGIAHHKVGNVSFRVRSKHLKIWLVLAGCSIVGALLASTLALRVSKLWLNTYIGAMVFLIGIGILLTLKRSYAFSWKKIAGLGLVAAFNKGLSGGGYGPVVTGGQILSGVESKSAIGITSFAEGVTCAAGLAVFYYASVQINQELATTLSIGALLSVPFSVFLVRRIPTRALKMSIAVVTIVLGLLTLGKTYLF